MARKGFEDLIVWQKASKFFIEAVKDVKSFPKSRIGWILEDNLLRAANSISANISEGHGRKSNIEFRQFLGISKGSASECLDQYLKIKDLGCLPEQIIKERIETLREIDKMLRSFMYKLV